MHVVLIIARLLKSMKELVDKFPGGYEEWKNGQSTTEEAKYS
jgi:hypothetical protein